MRNEENMDYLVKHVEVFLVMYVYLKHTPKL